MLGENSQMFYVKHQVELRQKVHGGLGGWVNKQIVHGYVLHINRGIWYKDWDLEL